MDIEKKLKELLQLSGENEVVEFKEANNNFDFRKLCKYFSALSNEANLKGLTSAWLIFGVNDQRTVVGTQYRPDRPDIESLKEEVANKMTSRITFIEIHEVHHKRGRVLLFQIPPAPKNLPVAYDGHYYGRDGEALFPLNLEEFDRIRNKGVLEDWSAEICNGATLDDLDVAAIVRAREVFSIKNPKFQSEVSGWSDVVFLNKAKLTIQGKITRACLLLLGNDESEHYLSPGRALITWILKDRDGIEKDYEHFSCPLLLAVDQVFSKIRNLKYRYLLEGTLFPEEVDQYEPYIIKEALNNCIAHQDYALGGRISVVEFEDGRLCFSNMGSFIPETVDNVIRMDAPVSRYRNSFLASAMVNLNMIDTIGSGILKMFMLQKNKFFPLPEYDLSGNHVNVMITGKVLDIHYANQLAQLPELSLNEIIVLDRVQKQLPITDEQVKYLRKLKLIEGRKPNFYIAKNVAQDTGKKASYSKNKAFDKQYYLGLICKSIAEHGSLTRKDIDELLWNKLPEWMSDSQKKSKVGNLITELRKAQKIENSGLFSKPKWVLFKNS